MAVIRTFLLTIVILAVFYAIAVQTLDPRGDFNRRPMTGVALDAQAVKASRFSGYAAGWRVTALVLGSSRSMKIDPKALHAGVTRRWAVAYAVGFFIAYLFLNETPTAFLYYQF